MNLLLALALFGSMPTVFGETCDSVDLVELNVMYDDEGRQCLRQMIFYDWSKEDARFNVVAWRLWKTNITPTRLFHMRGYELIWQDGETLRRIHTKQYTESHTQHDPEMRQRSIFPKDMRRGLTTTQRNEPSESGLIP